MSLRCCAGALRRRRSICSWPGYMYVEQHWMALVDVRVRVRVEKVKFNLRTVERLHFYVS